MPNKKSQGVLTIEACISFTCFAMIMFTILFIIKIVYTYGIIQHSITQTAKELATYSYVSKAAGLLEINGTINDSTSAGIDNFNKKSEAIVNSYDSLVNFKDTISELGESAGNKDMEVLKNNFNKTEESYEELKTNYPESVSAIKSIASDPKKALKSVASVFVKGTAEKTKTFVGGELVRYMSAKYISSPDNSIENANKKLTDLRVIGGLEGLDFSSSKFFTDDSNDIDIIVCYTIKPIMPIDIIPEIHLVNRVKVRAWTGSNQEK